MSTWMARLWVCLCVLQLPLFGELNGPPIFRTGTPVDGGRDCTVCHFTFRPANSDPRGRLILQVGHYTPGVKQTIRVRIEHPEAMRWGFSMTARLASDERQKAGTFTVTDDIRVRCAPDERDAPCGDDVEFASHRRPSTSPGTPFGKTFEVEWTPPSTDAGDIVFYAGGNAANNNNLQTGDRIYTTSARISSCSLTGRPTIAAVASAASGEPGLAVNSMISLFGTGFAPPGRPGALARLDADGTISRELACLGVEIGGRRAPVTFVGQNQINAQVPTLPTGPVEVRVIAAPGRPDEGRSEARNLPLQDYAPAFFTFFSNGRNIAAQHANFDLLADPSVVAGARPAAPGDIAILYGTGFGVSDPVWQAGELPGGLAPLRDPFSVTIGGITLPRADVLYGGLSPGSISGLYQFNVKIPASTPDGDVPVVIEIGGRRTQAGATIRVRRP